MVDANAVVTTEADEAHLRDLLEMPVRSEDDEPLVTPQQEQEAANAEQAGLQAAIDEQRRQFDTMRKAFQQETVAAEETA